MMTSIEQINEIFGSLFFFCTLLLYNYSIKKAKTMVLGGSEA